MDRNTHPSCASDAVRLPPRNAANNTSERLT
jgi:hypothetical protein